MTMKKALMGLGFALALALGGTVVQAAAMPTVVSAVNCEENNPPVGRWIDSYGVEHCFQDCCNPTVWACCGDPLPLTCEEEGCS